MLGEKETLLNPEELVEEFELLTKDAGRVQEDTLRKILEENSEIAYLQKWGLNGRTDPESFKACIPLAFHKDLEPYIQRIADGDDSPILTGKPISTISLSSGTTQGKQKFIPFSDEFFDCTCRIFKLSFAYRNRDFPIPNGKVLQFIYSSKQFKTKGGLAAGTATTNLFNNPQYSKIMKAMNTPCCSPVEVIFSPDFHQALYCHLLCGLIFRDEIQFVSSTFAHGIVLAFRTFEQVWEELCTDIREGVLSSRITIPSIQTAMSKLLKPNSELADTIYYKCKGLSNWYGLIQELFPNARYIHAIMTGTMLPYLKKLRNYAGDLPLICADYGASEGWIGLNVHPKLPPELATFAVVPNIGYFEFIPLRDSVDGFEARPVGLTEVKVGEEYEIIFTNFTGMYRYRLGDVVKVKGFYNSTPELQFVCRRNLLLSIDIDKNTEEDLQLSVEATAKILADSKLELIDFTSYVNASTYPGHYVIFWEVSGEASDEVLKECCNCLDRSFVDAGYITSRKVKSIGPLELRVVRRGTFHKILDHYVDLGAAASQFKTPRYVGENNSAVLGILSSNVVMTHFSTEYN